MGFQETNFLFFIPFLLCLCAESSVVLVCGGLKGGGLGNFRSRYSPTLLALAAKYQLVKQVCRKCDSPSFYEFLLYFSSYFSSFVLILEDAWIFGLCLFVMIDFSFYLFF